MTFWSTKEFRESVDKILPYDYSRVLLDEEKWIGESSLELSLGDEVFISSEKNPRHLDEENNVVKIGPGDFALLITKEWVSIPLHCMAFIAMKSKHKLSGLVNISGFHVDPGYEGKLKFSVYNAGPTAVVLRRGDPTFIIFVTDIYPNAERRKHEHAGQKHIEPREMMPLLGAGVSVHDVNQRLSKIETLATIYGGILIGVFLILLKLVLKPG